MDIEAGKFVFARTPEDVAETIELARRGGIPLAVRSGGHCFAGRSSGDGTGIVLDVSPMDTVTLEGSGTATIGAGARLGRIYDTLTGAGATIPAGCGPTVGIAGLTLGGGLGVLGRRYGLTSDSLLRAQVVLADGRVVDCDEDAESDLFWALRGAGGGQFGVVTSLTFRTVPAPALTGLHLTWAIDDAVRVIDAWQHWAPDGPDELAASLLVTGSDRVADPPVVNVFGTLIDESADAPALLRDLVDRVGVEPSTAVHETRTFRNTKRYLVSLGDRMTEADRRTEPMRSSSRSEFFERRLPTATVEALVDHFIANRVEGQSRELDFSPWAGQYNRIPTEATAFAHRTARFLLKQAVAHPAGDRAAHEPARQWLDASWNLVHPWGTGGVYPNFPDPSLEDWGTAYHGANLARLIQVKTAYDPDDLFTFPQAISAAP